MSVLLILWLGFAGTLGKVVATRHDTVTVRVMNTKGEMKIRFMDKCDAEAR